MSVCLIEQKFDKIYDQQDKKSEFEKIISEQSWHDWIKLSLHSQS